MTDRNRTAAEWKREAVLRYTEGEIALQQGRTLDAHESFTRAGAAAALASIVAIGTPKNRSTTRSK